MACPEQPILPRHPVQRDRIRVRAGHELVAVTGHGFELVCAFICLSITAIENGDFVSPRGYVVTFGRLVRLDGDRNRMTERAVVGNRLLLSVQVLSIVAAENVAP